MGKSNEHKKLYTLRIEPSLVKAMDTLTDRDGVPVSEQIRRGIRMWLEAKGVSVAAQGKRKTMAAKKRRRA